MESEGTRQVSHDAMQVPNKWSAAAKIMVISGIIFSGIAITFAALHLFNKMDVEKFIIKKVPDFLQHPHEHPLKLWELSALSAFIVAGLAGITFITAGSKLSWTKIKEYMEKRREEAVIQDGNSKIIQPKQEIAEPQKSDEELFNEFLNSYKQNGLEALQQLEQKGFFRDKSQDKAKHFFSRVMQEIFGARVFFPTSVKIIPVEGAKQLDVRKFCLKSGADVANDIKKSAEDADRIHVYQVASQYNAAEAVSPLTPPIGQAMKASTNDNTQGPLAQRTNPVAFELVTAFLTHLGFNMLAHALPMAGTTFTRGDLVEHGYLMPTNAKLDPLSQQLQERWQETEYVCYESKISQGKYPVYIYLQAAPAISYAKRRGLAVDANTDELEKYAALSNYAAFFQSGIELASQNPGQPVVLHLTAVGGKSFGNKNKNLQWGLEQAIFHFQDRMPENLHVQLESRDDTSANAQIAKNLGIQ